MLQCGEKNKFPKHAHHLIKGKATLAIELNGFTAYILVLKSQ